MKTNMQITGLIISLMVATVAQAQPADTLVVRVGKESKVIFAIKDKQDLETLKHYNFQALMDDMLAKLEKRDTSSMSKSSSEYRKDTTQQETTITPSDTWVRDQPRDEDRDTYRRERRRRVRSYHSWNIDLGMNNYLENGHFPDGNNQLYTVKPWGSWYVGLTSTLRTRLSGKFYIEWGAGVSWYNFKFTNYKATLDKDDNGVIFYEKTDPVEYTKSKLTVAYVNISMVPMFDLGGYSRKPMVFNGDRLNFDRRGSFRIGIGPYVGYRLDSYTKQVWEEGGDTKKSHVHDNYYLNNIRYGLRAQMGFRDTDIFFAYDLNDLFIEGKGPRLHAFSFGITL
ncbi:MAG: hypothetical protein JNK10_06440 [Cyclobacteriaceae bacterium]|nr:hypothetical protein [Cyclobacteriaceae bacterium]